MHISTKVVEVFAQSGINWCRAPPESPDLNPIENLWHKLKKYIRCEVKPCNKSELESVQKCCKYINHFQNVISHVIDLLKGAATGY